MKTQQPILVAMDSFKGSLSSAEANQAVFEGIRQINPDQRIRQIKVADGGEGTVEALTEVLALKEREVTVLDALGRTSQATYGCNQETGCAVIEVASACGLPQLPVKELNAVASSSFGVGQIIADALSQGVNHIYLGLGGTATTDGGTGMLQALGFRFMTQRQPEIIRMEELVELDFVETENVLPSLTTCRFTIICDVNNVFHGPLGAAFIYGPQKGASAEEVKNLDERLARVAEVIHRQTGMDVQSVPGAGAAGGIGGACIAFLAAELKQGAELILDMNGVTSRDIDYALIFSGEGKIDGQTFRGKLPLAIGRMGEQLRTPVILLGGSVEASVEDFRGTGITAAFSIMQHPVALEEIMKPEAAYNALKMTAAHVYATCSSVSGGESNR